MPAPVPNRIVKAGLSLHKILCQDLHSGRLATAGEGERDRTGVAGGAWQHGPGALSRDKEISGRSDAGRLGKATVADRDQSLP